MHAKNHLYDKAWIFSYDAKVKASLISVLVWRFCPKNKVKKSFLLIYCSLMTFGLSFKELL